MKPKMFIASSVEGLDVANNIQINLDHEVETTIWSQGVFRLSGSAIDDLISYARSTDFGIFVFTPDDETKIRGLDLSSVRDNVVFELGLFIGALGKERTFIVKPRSVDIHIPSDLTGVTPGEYDAYRTDGNLTAALGVFCTQVKQQIRRLGPQKVFDDCKALMDSINPVINANVKAGHLSLPVNIASLNMIKLHELSRKQYFDQFLSFKSTGSILSGNSNSNGGINDVLSGQLEGNILIFTDVYKRKL